MPLRKLLRSIGLILVIFGLVYPFAFGFDDGFGAGRQIQGKYFVIIYSSGLEAVNLAQQLNIGQAEKILFGGSSKRASGYDEILSDMLDTLFLQVGDILDMHLYSYQGRIKVCRNQEQLNQIYNNMFNRDLKGMRSFYIYNLNTIYISGDSFTREILGHEIAHAIISNYFVVQPPVKVAEVLSGYVEYQLRKPGQK